MPIMKKILLKPPRRPSLKMMRRSSSSLSLSSSLASIMRSRQPSVADLLEEKDWEALRDVLKTDTARDEVALSKTALHDACRLGAPSDIVYAVAEIDPEARMRKDSNGRTPLHTACGAYRSRDDCDSGLTPDGDVIDLLVLSDDDGAVETINEEDNDGRTAFYYAVLNGVREKTVDRLSEASERARRAAASGESADGFYSRCSTLSSRSSAALSAKKLAILLF